MTEITWTNCAEQMPQDDDREIIIKRVGYYQANSAKTDQPILTPANEIGFDIDMSSLDYWEWTPYTPEKWKELNK